MSKVLLYIDENNNISGYRDVFQDEFINIEKIQKEINNDNEQSNVVLIDKLEIDNRVESANGDFSLLSWNPVLKKVIVDSAKKLEKNKEENKIKIQEEAKNNSLQNDHDVRILLSLILKKLDAIDEKFETASDIGDLNTDFNEFKNRFITAFDKEMEELKKLEE